MRLLEALSSYSSRPTLEEAKRIVRLPDIHNVAISVATDVREAALEFNATLTKEGRLPLQYRGFLVGGASIALRLLRDDFYEWVVEAAHNTKERKKDDQGNEWPKKCSEMRLGETGLEERCTCFLAVAVVGNPQPDGRSLRLRSTLDPCEACRDDMRGRFSQLYRDDTLVITSNPVTKARRVRSVPNLMRDHGEWWSTSSNIIAMVRKGR